MTNLTIQARHQPRKRDRAFMLITWGAAGLSSERFLTREGAEHAARILDARPGEFVIHES